MFELAPLLLLKAWSIVAVMMTFLWLAQAKMKNAGYVDIGWTLGLALCALVYALNINGYLPRRFILLMMVCFWAGRLALLLVRRLMKDPSEDSRYRRIREDWKTNQNMKFFFMFQFQGLLDVVLSWVFLLIFLNPSQLISSVEIIGVLIWLAGIIGESIADEQLHTFKINPANKGKTCDLGLWYYSRHPNYFFEWLIWVGYAVIALASPWGWSGIIAPVLMLYFLLKVSGIPLAEAQALKTKGEEYRRYQESTSMFIPLPKRKK